MVRATTPAPLSLSAAVPPTNPVVYSPVPTINVLTLLFSDIVNELFSSFYWRLVLLGYLVLSSKVCDGIHSGIDLCCVDINYR